MWGQPASADEIRLALDNWLALEKGHPVGKQLPFRFNVGTTGAVMPGNLVQVQSPDDSRAMQLCVTLKNPLIAKDPGINSGVDINQYTGPFFANIATLDPSTGSQANGINNLFPNGPIWANGEAVIEWGAGGVQHQAIVDMANGTCLNLTASFVRVKGIVTNLHSNGQSAIYQLGAQISPGWSKWTGAQKTINHGSIDTSDACYLTAIPLFARRVNILAYLLDNPTTPWKGQIRFWRNAIGNTAPTNTVGAYQFDAGTGEPLPIPAGAMYFDIVNLTASSVNRVFSIFDLAI